MIVDCSGSVPQAPSDFCTGSKVTRNNCARGGGEPGNEAMIQPLMKVWATASAVIEERGRVWGLIRCTLTLVSVTEKGT